jgi:hypothetical protein
MFRNGRLSSIFRVSTSTSRSPAWASFSRSKTRDQAAKDRRMRLDRLSPGARQHRGLGARAAPFVPAVHGTEQRGPPEPAGTTGRFAAGNPPCCFVGSTRRLRPRCVLAMAVRGGRGPQGAARRGGEGRGGWGTCTRGVWRSPMLSCTGAGPTGGAGAGTLVHPTLRPAACPHALPGHAQAQDARTPWPVPTTVTRERVTTFEALEGDDFR